MILRHLACQQGEHWQHELCLQLCAGGQKLLTSLLTVSVLYLSSQYMVLMRYSCWMDSTGHRSRVMSSSVFLGLLPITRKVTACSVVREQGREGSGKQSGLGGGEHCSLCCSKHAAIRHNSKWLSPWKGTAARARKGALTACRQGKVSDLSRF
jgi:hypothetical protein